MDEQSDTEAICRSPNADDNSDAFLQDDWGRLEEGIPSLRELVDSVPRNHPRRPIHLFQLSMQLGALFTQRPEMALMFEAIRAGREAIDSLPTESPGQAELSTILEQDYPGHPGQAEWSAILDSLLGDRFSVTAKARQERPVDNGVYVPDCGPGELGSGQLPHNRRILGCGLSNQPYDDDGNLSIFDVLAGTFDVNGRWSYSPIRKGIFESEEFQRTDLGGYEYEPGDVLYQEDGTSYLANQREIRGQKHRFLAVDSWRHLADCLPTRLIQQRGMARLLPTQHTAAASNLCHECAYLNLESTLSSLHQPSSDCDLCDILSKCPREEQPELRLIDARKYLRICSIPDPGTSTSPQDSREPVQDTSDMNLVPGLPAFLESGSKDHFSLIIEWLRLCDEGKCGHASGCAPERSSHVKPARVIHIPAQDPFPAFVRLLAVNETDVMEPYIALSHCWGSQVNGLPTWCTTRANEERRRTQGIPMESLPANFRDTIRVAHELGIEHLWIDSLCILQGDREDWIAEGQKMAAVFQNAYCVVAASSAASATQGFLNRPASESSSQYATAPNTSHGSVFISSVTDDFVSDVEQSVLNTRAWVLQERILARRTIHFTERQTHFECGGGIRCETLTYMRNEGRASLFCDPNFPASLGDRASIAKFNIFSGLLEKYSQLGITVKTDRPVAIDSLSTKLANTLDTTVRSGIFESFLHRSILWRRLNEPLEHITFEAGSKVPSWSWMAYSGPIKYADVKVKVEWDSSVRLKEGGSLEARLAQLQLESQGCRSWLSPLGCHEIECESQGAMIGQFWLDDPRQEDLSEVSAAIIGREQNPEGSLPGEEQNYLLLLIKKGRMGEFERVGMGSLERNFIQLDESPTLVYVK